MTPPLLQAVPEIETDEPTSLLVADEFTTLLADEFTELAPSEPTELLPSVAAEGSARAVLETQLAGLIAGIRGEAKRAGLDQEEELDLLRTARAILDRYVEDATPADPDAAPADPAKRGSIAPGSLLLNSFVVRTLLARGGMGEIYRVRHRDLKTDHAIKVIVPEYRDDSKVVRLFHEEGRLLPRVRHEAVIDCAGLFRDEDGRSMILLEYLDGPSLSQMMRRGPMGLSALEALARRVGAGLTAIHAAGIVHRDISPDNILLPGDNPAAAKIIDFGVARALQNGQTPRDGLDFAGKYSFASPEQLGMFGGAIGIASDVYSLGLLLIGAARGEKLAMGQTMDEAMAARERIPPLDGLPDRLRPIVERMLQPEPRRRPTDLTALLRCLSDPAMPAKRSWWPFWPFNKGGA